MNRRKTLIGIGAVLSGSAGALGTGAFSSVEAERQVTVNVAEDADAYLGIDPDDPDYPNSAYAAESDGIVEIDLTEDTETSEGVFADGVSPDAVTRIEEILPVRNQGTQEVQVSIESDGLPTDGFDILATDVPGQDDTSLLEGDLPTLVAGDEFALGVEVDATINDLAGLEDTLDGLEVTIIADAEEVNDS